MKIVPYVVISPWIPFQHGIQKREITTLITELSKRYDRVYVADHDGIFKNKPQLDLVQYVCDEMPTLYEGGVRFSTNVIDMLITGAEKAVIGTGTLVDLSELGGAFKLSENITFKVDFRDGIVSSDPAVVGRAISDLFRDVVEIGIDEIVVPRALAEEASSAKSQLGFTLGVIAPASEQTSLEPLEVDYIVSEDYGSLVQDE